MAALALVQPSLDLVPQQVPPMRIAYNMSGLAEQGYTYQQALAAPLIRLTLSCHARAIAARKRRRA